MSFENSRHEFSAASPKLTKPSQNNCLELKWSSEKSVPGTPMKMFAQGPKTEKKFSEWGHSRKIFHKRN